MSKLPYVDVLGDRVAVLPDVGRHSRRGVDLAAAPAEVVVWVGVGEEAAVLGAARRRVLAAARANCRPGRADPELDLDVGVELGPAQRAVAVHAGPVGDIGTVRGDLGCFAAVLSM